jgi:predicted lipid-binding transport protein (Tim44 family)
MRVTNNNGPQVAQSKKLFYSIYMPLSEHERRLLAQMEEALAADDPRLVSAMSGTSGVSRNRLGIGVALVIAGLAILFGGLIAQITVIGLGGFLTALTGSILIFRAVTAPGALVSATQKGSGKDSRARNPRKKLGDRLQDRWDQRNFE